MNGKSEFCTVIVPEKVNSSQLEGLNRQPIVTELHTGCAQSATPAFCIPEPVGRSASSLPRVPYITQVHQDSVHIIGAPSSSHQPPTPPAATHLQAVAGAVDSQSLSFFNPPPTQIPSLFSVPQEVVPSSSVLCALVLVRHPRKPFLSQRSDPAL
ncbi:hypothetical protein CPB86DRAFT_782439 [Serendipita vermifera]|nr:hypothetical protein CPB86DRAFT_782439 [Serendipita vermifera]